MNTYTVPEAAALCFCSTDVIYQLVRDGTLKARKVGRAWVILEESLMAGQVAASRQAQRAAENASLLDA